MGAKYELMKFLSSFERFLDYLAPDPQDGLEYIQMVLAVS